MFWRFGGYANVSTIDSLLEKPDVTVEELLEDADLIQEVKSQNSKLLEFLRDENILDRLMQYIVMPKTSDDQSTQQSEKEREEDDTTTSSPKSITSLFAKNKRRSRSKSMKEDDDSKEEKQRAKYAYVSCEVLSSDVWSVAEALMDNRDSLRRFWDYLKRDAPLDGLQAQYFCKVNESLLDKKTEEMLEFFKSIDGVVSDMLRHVDCAVMMDLLLKIVSLERNEGGAGIIDWLQTQNLVPLLLSNLGQEHEPSTQTAAGDFLKAVITISANATAQDANVIGPNELTRQLVSEDCVDMLIKMMLCGGNPLTVGVGIVIEVIRKNNSDYDLENQIGPIPKSSDPIYLGTLLRRFAHHISDFIILIQSKDKTRKELKVASGGSIEPLGFDRFKTCELMAELLHCSNMILLNQPGAENEVKARDTERIRLKVEGKLTAFTEESSTHEYGTSVDSSGFHHARAPSLSKSSPEESKRLEVSNSTDEDFEDVPQPVNLVEAKDDFEKEPESDVSTSKPAPLSFTKSSKAAEDELTSQLDAMTVTEKPTQEINPKKQDKEILSNESSAETKMLSQSDDKPAPLFSGKSRLTDTARDGSEHESHQTNETHFEDDSESDSSPFQADANGNPVVGDLLKMKFVEHRVVPTVIDFLFRFPWNNFLHNVVYDVVQQVFNGQMEHGYNRNLAIDVFDTGRITERIMEGQEASDEAQKTKKMRLGYMGHLTLIAEEVVKFTERIPPETLSQIVFDKTTSEAWTYYVEKTLTDTRERDNAILGGVRPDAQLGPRQAVLNAVNAAQGFSGISALANLTNSGTLGPETQTPSEDAASRSTYLFSGSSLMSGFSHGSSDEEDEGEEEEEQRGGSSFIDESEQQLVSGDTDQSTGVPSIPPPLNPTRARGKFAARMAQRRMEQAATQSTISQSAEDGGDDDDRHHRREDSPDEMEDVEHMVNVHIGDDGGDDDDDDDDDDGTDDSSEDVIVRGVEGGDVDVDEFLGSDDSTDGADVGIVMKKYERWSGDDEDGRDSGGKGNRLARVD